MNGTLLRILLIYSISAVTEQPFAHDLDDAWDADITQSVCLMASESGLSRGGESKPLGRSSLSVRTFVVAFHPGTEVPLERVSKIDREPYFISLQVITPSRVGEVGPKVTGTKIRLGKRSITPIADPTWKQEDLPVMYLGASDAKDFVGMLLDGDSPIVVVTLSDASVTEIPIATRRASHAREMMQSCQNQARKVAPN